MIIDDLVNIGQYQVLNCHFAKAIAFLQRKDLRELAVGRYELEGDKLFAIVAHERGVGKEDDNLECHRKYIDIQVVLGGVDQMGWLPRSKCVEPVEAYNENEDFETFADEAAFWLPVQAGMFTIFFPEDAHQAMVSSGTIHKVVIKVAC